MSVKRTYTLQTDNILISRSPTVGSVSLQWSSLGHQGVAGRAQFFQEGNTFPHYFNKIHAKRRLSVMPIFISHCLMTSMTCFTGVCSPGKLLWLCPSHKRRSHMPNSVNSADRKFTQKTGNGDLWRRTRLFGARNVKYSTTTHKPGGEEERYHALGREGCSLCYLSEIFTPNSHTRCVFYISACL